jgi:hypothetical protein
LTAAARTTSSIAERCGFLILEPPEVEDPDPVGVERARQVERALEQLLLLRIREAGAELVARGTEPRLRRARPVDLEDRRREARNAQLEALEDLLHVGDLRRVPVHEVLAARFAQVDKPMPNSRDATSQACPKSCEISSVSTETDERAGDGRRPLQRRRSRRRSEPRQHRTS